MRTAEPRMLGGSEEPARKDSKAIAKATARATVTKFGFHPRTA